ncbi:MAG: type III-A CRISPR-associated protein Cas10/Csm1 [Bacteroidota bacterium]
MSNTESQRQKIYLAALLHDIGKFYQRASGNSSEDDSNLSEQTKNIEDYICPKDPQSQRRTHKHVLWTNDFLEKNETIGNVKEKGNQIFKVNPWEPGKLYEDNLTNLAANHHTPNSEMQKIIQMADWWSAGMDRVGKGEDDKKELNHHKLKFSDFKSVPLFSVFNSLQVNDKKKPPNPNVAYSLKSLDIDRENIFPKILSQQDVRSLKEDYKTLWDEFETQFSQLPTDSFDGFEESLYYLLKKFTWSIPSNTMDMANVSLFDHLKTTAAIADSLFVASNDEAFAEAFDFSKQYDYLKGGHYPLMMVGIDLSGIQSFIYDIASKKAAQSLKGRSFYLQLLMDAILQKFKDKSIGAKAGHTLYASGGKAYLLLPNTTEVKEKIFGKEGIKETVEDELWAEHKGKLAINIDAVGFAYHSRREGDSWQTWVEIENQPGERKCISYVWKALSDKLNQQKNQKFKSRLIDHFEEYFDEKYPELQAGGNTEGENGIKTCAVTGEEITGEYEKLDDGIFVTPIVKNQTDLGKTLKDADYIISFRGKPEEDTYLSNRAKANITVLSNNYYLFDKRELTKDEAEFRTKISSADVSKVSTINKLDFLDAPLKGQQVSYGYEFYGGNEQACHRDKKGNILTKEIEVNNRKITSKDEKTYDKLARTESNETSLLGILRMDIDNLGKLFIKGLKPEHLSLSTYATLSFQLELFFSGYLNTLRDSEVEIDENGNPKKDKNGNTVYRFRDWLNILYSGGDDLFVVGRWDKTIEFAEIVKKRFEEFTHRSDIGISGGIAFVHEKFPIAKAAEMAGEAESASKAWKNKNAMTFFGETISWDEEFKKVRDLKETLVKYINRKEKPLSKSILHKLILYNEVKDKHLKNPNQKPDYSFVWHTAYYLKRYVEKYDRNSEVYRFIMDELQENLFQSSKNEYRYYELAALAARWAEMELKDKDKEEKHEA